MYQHTIDEKFNLTLTGQNGIWNIGLKMTVKSGLEKIFLKLLMRKAIIGPSDLLHRKENFSQNYKFSNKNYLI